MLELLAPAGAMEALRAAVQNGADAVYLGCGAFNARQSAKNFTPQTLVDAIKYCHVRGVQVHLTLNTLVSDREMTEAAELGTRKVICDHSTVGIVVTTDGRGTTGRGPQWDRAIYETMKSVTLEDQIDAVRALPEALEALAGENAAANVPQPDLSRVAMIGWSYGGFLSALAVLEAPETFAAACAGAPPTDWTMYDTHYTERYLGLDSAVNERNSIIADAPQLDRPLMLIHGFADDNVTIAHSLRQSLALMATGRKHTFLPLTGITHMTTDETVAETLLILQRDFLAEALG